jgi:hypothetical protein
MAKFIAGIVVGLAVVGALIYWLLRGGLLQLGYQAVRQGVLRLTHALGTAVGQQANRLRGQGQQLQEQGQQVQQEAGRLAEQANRLTGAADQLRQQVEPPVLPGGTNFDLTS